MKDIISRLDKTFESRIRLGVMSILLVNERVDFTILRNMLEVTDGNLASHLNALVKKGYIEVKKQFIGNKPNTSYSVTLPGRKAFNNHLDNLEKLIKSNLQTIN